LYGGKEEGKTCVLLRRSKNDLCPDEAKALKGVELKATKQRLVMFGSVI